MWLYLIVSAAFIIMAIAAYWVGRMHSVRGFTAKQEDEFERVGSEALTRYQQEVGVD